MAEYMKKIKLVVLALVAVVLSVLMVPSAFAQAPADLSFLTNRASLASWALKQVSIIEVSVAQSAAGSPNEGIPTETRRFGYSGPASLSAMAKFLKGQTFTPTTPIPGSITMVNILLKNILPNGNEQEILGGGVSGKAVYDGTNWVLPSENSEPPIYLSYRLFIPAMGVTKAWVVETNQWGWSYKKTLDLCENYGFYFEGTLAGEAYLCLEFGTQKGDGPAQYVYDLHNGGVRSPLPAVIAKISLRDSEDIRDFSDNPSLLWHWVYTFMPENSSLTYGKVPLLIANFTGYTNTMLSVSSAVGSASKFSVTRMADKWSPTEYNFIIDVPVGANFVYHNFTPGLYHIVPLGIDVCADWWKISEVDGWSYGKGGGTVVVTPTVNP